MGRRRGNDSSRRSARKGTNDALAKKTSKAEHGEKKKKTKTDLVND